MKLTKGRINKLLKSHKQTFKKYAHSVTSVNRTNDVIEHVANNLHTKQKHSFTLRNKKKPLNLINKSLHNYKAMFSIKN